MKNRMRRFDGIERRNLSPVSCGFATSPETYYVGDARAPFHYADFHEAFSTANHLILCRSEYVGALNYLDDLP